MIVVKCSLCAWEQDVGLGGLPVHECVAVDSQDLPIRISRRIAETPAGHWEWLGGQNAQGIGVAWHNRRSWLIHRLTYQLLRGTPPVVLRRECRSHGCANPFHWTKE